MIEQVIIRAGQSGEVSTALLRSPLGECGTPVEHQTYSCEDRHQCHCKNHDDLAISATIA